MAWWDDLARFGDRVAVLAPDEQLTYRRLAQRVDEAAARLGGGRKLVLLAASNEVDALVTYLAGLRGGHAVLLVPGGDASHLAGVIAAYDPDVVVSATGRNRRFDVRRAVTAHDLHGDLALLLSTSGSTGSSRLVRLSHANLEANAEAIAQYLDVRETDRAATSLPMHYCYGLSVVNSHLLRGAGLLLSDRSVLDRCFWDTFRSAGGTALAGVPHTFDLLDRIGFESLELPSLRYVTQAGGRLAPERVRRYAELGRRQGWDLFVMYGQTEATARMAYLPPAWALSHPEAIGVPIPGGSFEIDDGELVYRGPNVMLGYAEGPDDLALGRTVHALRTGDLARRTSDGLYEVTGRRSRLVKPFGLRLDLDQIERLLAEGGIPNLCTGDDDHVVVAVPSGQDHDEVRRLLRRRVGLPPGRVRVCAVDDPPRLASGKVDYVAVARLGRATTEQRHGGGTVRAAFAEVLATSDVPDDATFVSLGGDSLSYVELTTRLDDALGFLPPDWHTTPVHQLAVLEPRRKLVTRIETSVVLRAVAIVLVVGSHSNVFRALGGAHVLLGIAGFNFARLNLATGGVGRTRQLLVSAAHIAVPSVLWIGFCHVATKDQFGPANLLLLNNHLGSAQWDERWHFWYVEALVQILVLAAALLTVPAVRRWERSWPFCFPMALLGMALLVRFGLVTVWATDEPFFEPQTLLWIFLLGWAAARATTVPQRLVVSGVIALSVPGFFDAAARESVVAGGLLLLLWVPRIAVVRPLNRLLTLLAGASLYIYLTHFEVWPPLLRRFTPGVAMVASIAVGIAAWVLARRVTRLLRPRKAGGGGAGVAAGEAEVRPGLDAERPLERAMGRI